MSRTEGVEALPAIAALDAHSVLEGTRPGASLQLDETYFTGQLRVLRALESVSDVESRIHDLERSLELYSEITLELDTPTRENLLEASRRFRTLLQQLPEVNALRNAFPGTCVVFPEWLRTEREIKYGARIYLFRNGTVPDPEEIVRRNVDAVVDQDRTSFDGYRGRLHGYPECCIEFHSDRTAPPEVRSVTPFEEYVDEAALDGAPNTSTSIARLVPGLLEDDASYGFFAKAFYPGPGCSAAAAKGREIFGELAESYGETVARDHFRLNFATSYVRGRGVLEGAERLPEPGSLGREHLYFYLPLGSLLTVSRYS